MTKIGYKTTIFWEIFKDAGFVHESFQIDTKRTFLTFFSYETNPQNKSYENCVTKRIHETNLLNTVGQNESMKRIHETNLLNTIRRNESTKRIFWKPEGFGNPKLPSKVRLCSKDSSGFVRICWIRWNVSQNESTKRILWNLCHETNPQNESYENCVTKRIHETNFLKTRRIQIRESGFAGHKSGFVKRIHVFTNLLYDSRILRNFSLCFAINFALFQLIWQLENQSLVLP